MKSISFEETAVAELLGRLDYVFWPWRDMRQPQVLWELRQGWLHGRGLPTRSHGSNEAQRKETEGVFRKLEKSHLVTVTARAGRRTHVRLTPMGETFARIICATGFVALHWDDFQAFADLIDSTNEVTLPESYVAGLEPWEGTPEQVDALSRQTFRFLPFATAGLLGFSGDAYGRQWIALTTKGRKAIEAGRPDEPAEDWELIEEASTVYEAAFEAEGLALASAKPERPSNLIPPVGCGRGWGDYAPVLASRQTERRAKTRHTR